ncbi:MAG TPA: ribosome-binding factor A [Candidatus Paceibacterota bacterium]
MKDRIETANQILRDATAQFLARESGPQSLITVTRAQFSTDLTHADVFLSVLPKDKEIAALGLATRNRDELKRYLKDHTKLPRIPFIVFKIEPSLA